MSSLISVKTALAYAFLFGLSPQILSSQTGLDTAGRQAHYEAREHPSEYNGPGREESAPEDVTEVRIGYFGPSDPGDPEGGDLWLAANLALEEANAEGGYRGIPFRLVAAWSENPWGTGISQVVRMAYSDRVWAIIGSIDGASTHLAEQVVAKARLTLINPASTDKTLNLAHVAWMFSCLPGDHRLAPVVARAVLDRIGNGPFTLVSSTDHDSRVFAAELEASLTRRRAFPDFDLHIGGGEQGFSYVVRQVLSSQSRALIIVAGPLASARLLISLRRAGYTGPVFGGPSMGRRSFVERVNSAGDGVLFPLLYSAAVSSRFAERFQERFGREPDFATVHTYDATWLLVDAIREAGLNRARIRDAVAELAPWKGESGTFAWDPLGQNERPVGLGTLENGRVRPVSP